MNDSKEFKKLSVGVALFLICAIASASSVNYCLTELEHDTSESGAHKSSNEVASLESSQSGESGSALSSDASESASSAAVSSEEVSSASSLATGVEEENKILYSQIEDLLCEDVRKVLDPVAENSWDKFSDIVLDLDKFITFSTDHAAISEDKKALLSLLLLEHAIQNELFEDEIVKGNVLEVKSQLSLQLESFEKLKYSDDIYNEFIDLSQEFSRSGKKTEMILPRQVIFVGQDFILQKAPIKYDDHVLISLDDVSKYTNSNVQADEKNCTFAVQNDKVLLEFSRGSNVCYVNDKTSNMEVPSLYFNDTVYMSADFFAETYGIQCKYMSDNGIIVFYGKK